MAITVALLGGAGSGRAALATALRQALATQAPDEAVRIDDLPSPAGHHRYDLTLLLALHDSDGPAAEAVDARLRAALHGAGLPFQIVFGQGGERVRHALRAIGSVMGRTLVVDDPALTLGRGPWSCDHCSDPDCEHRLFTGLLARP